MFFSTDNLTSVGDLSGWNTSQVTNMSDMFSNAKSLTSLDLSTWDTSQVTDMSYMFYNAFSLISLDLSNWDTLKVTDSANMFKHADKLQQIKVGDKVGTNVLSQLPQQSSTNIPGADGKWYSKATGTGYLPANIPGNKADTYLAVKP